MNLSETSFLSTWKQILVPPGQGVYTVHTAREQKDRLYDLLYPASTSLQIREQWEKALSHLGQILRPTLLGIPSDAGGGILRGANWGPLAVRLAYYASNPQHKDTVSDVGDIRVIPHFILDEYLHPDLITKCRQSLFLDPQIELPVSPLSMAQLFCQQYFQHYSHIPLITVGGDHSVSYPLVKEYLLSRKKAGKKVFLLHFDAHTDLLKERLGVDICFGSWLSHIIPLLESPAHLIQLGIRSSGKNKDFWEKSLGITQYWSQEIREQGLAVIIEKINDQLKKLGVDEGYVTFDIDCLDREYAHATGTPEDHGLYPHEPVLIMQSIFSQFRFGGADLVEVAPFTQMPPSPQYSHGATSTLMSAKSLLSYFVEAGQKSLQPLIQLDQHA
jgi:agmatinase